MRHFELVTVCESSLTRHARVVSVVPAQRSVQFSEDQMPCTGFAAASPGALALLLTLYRSPEDDCYPVDRRSQRLHRQGLS